ncbi:MAG TPA: AAA family ATPase [Candidatus Marinimicrobia bacterium]|nr:AAA family ATPase [Candidatus Neomarinimicrobiota bacterium]
MEKFFNNAGPTIPADHYHIDPLTRINWEDILQLIAQKRYFLLHAPRQTGKTSTLLAMMHALNAQGQFACAYANIEGAQTARNDVERGVDAVCSSISSHIDTYLPGTELGKWYYSSGRDVSSNDRLRVLLQHWTTAASKPTILFLDEVDALVGDTLISLLRQIRAGYAQRPESFPQSLILCGVRDIQDYRIHSSNQEIITGGSAFNIKAESLRMGNFSPEECRTLLLQHTEATGQSFQEAIFPLLWEDTEGQPWLVNALAYELTWRIKALRDRSIPITVEHYMQAREELIQSRATHLDQLVDKLKEERVHRVISAILSGEEEPSFRGADLDYVYDLGLIQKKPSVRIANRIYMETIPRELTWAKQVGIANQDTGWYVAADGSLNMPKLLRAFQQFFRMNAESWDQRFDYREAGPQLLLQAFLQRIINGGGRIHREYALGRRRTDLLIEWPTTEKAYFGAVQRIVIETKILRKSLESTIEEGVNQTKAYGQKAGAEDLHLIIFDRSDRPWEEKIAERMIDNVGIWLC